VERRREDGADEKEARQRVADVGLPRAPKAQAQMLAAVCLLTVATIMLAFLIDGQDRRSLFVAAALLALAFPLMLISANRHR
jgi:hypothetical protein